MLSTGPCSPAWLYVAWPLESAGKEELGVEKGQKELGGQRAVGGEEGSSQVSSALTSAPETSPLLSPLDYQPYPWC